VVIDLTYYLTSFCVIFILYRFTFETIGLPHLARWFYIMLNCLTKYRESMHITPIAKNDNRLYTSILASIMHMLKKRELNSELVISNFMQMHGENILDLKWETLTCRPCAVKW
jgi:hypothetical protein